MIFTFPEKWPIYWQTQFTQVTFFPCACTRGQPECTLYSDKYSIRTILKRYSLEEISTDEFWLKGQRKIHQCNHIVIAILPHNFLKTDFTGQ